MIAVVAIVLLLIGLNALFVAAEFAAVSVRGSRIRQRAQEGHRMARRLLPFLENPRLLDDYIAACQVGITLTSLILGAFGQAALSDVLVPIFADLGGLQAVAAETASAFAILLFLTVSQMVLGELVPKSLALQFPTSVSMMTIIPMEISLRILSPFIWILNGSGWRILRWMGVEPEGHRHLHSPAEIQYLVAESRKGGLLEPEEQRRLQHALSMGVRKVRQLMIPRTEMEALPAGLTLQEALERTRRFPYTRYPVYRNTIDGIVGFVHARDLAIGKLHGRGGEPLEALLRPILAVPEELTADRLLARMREGRAVMALVVDEFGGVAGIVTIHDLLTELLGEVADETWLGEPGPERLPDGRIRLPGRLPVHEAEEWTGLRWSEGESDTVNGALSERLGRLPLPGDTVEVDGVSVMVEDVEEMVARTVLVDILPGALPAEEESDG